MGPFSGWIESQQDWQKHGKWRSGAARRHTAQSVGKTHCSTVSKKSGTYSWTPAARTCHRNRLSLIEVSDDREACEQRCD
jgi:hypothetical protein